MIENAWLDSQLSYVLAGVDDHYLMYPPCKAGMVEVVTHREEGGGERD